MSYIIGIDIGGSTTKIVGLRDGVIVGATMVRASDPVTSAYGAFGRFLEEAGLKLQEIDRVICTGVGSSFLKDNIYGIPTSDMPTIDIDLATTVEIHFGTTTLKVIPTPGHTPGGVTLLNEQEKTAFTGDTLFRESIGRTDLEGGDYPTLMRSILESLLTLGDEVKIFPGHAESSTIGHESMYNPFVVEALQEQINYKQ